MFGRGSAVGGSDKGGEEICLFGRKMVQTSGLDNMFLEINVQLKWVYHCLVEDCIVDSPSCDNLAK